jgi:hypothetical protein
MMIDYPGSLPLKQACQKGCYHSKCVWVNLDSEILLTIPCQGEGVMIQNLPC